MKNLLSQELMQKILALNSKIVNGDIKHPARLALLLEEIATVAWSDARELGAATWEDAEDLPPSLRF